MWKKVLTNNSVIFCYCCMIADVHYRELVFMTVRKCELGYILSYSEMYIRLWTRPLMTAIR